MVWPYSNRETDRVLSQSLLSRHDFVASNHNFVLLHSMKKTGHGRRNEEMIFGAGTRKNKYDKRRLAFKVIASVSTRVPGEWGGGISAIRTGIREGTIELFRSLVCCIAAD